MRNSVAYTPFSGFLLAEPRLIEPPVRIIAAATGRISPQTMADLRMRLVTEEWVMASDRKHGCAPRGKEEPLSNE